MHNTYDTYDSSGFPNGNVNLERGEEQSKPSSSQSKSRAGKGGLSARMKSTASSIVVVSPDVVARFEARTGQESSRGVDGTTSSACLPGANPTAVATFVSPQPSAKKRALARLKQRMTPSPASDQNETLSCGNGRVRRSPSSSNSSGSPRNIKTVVTVGPLCTPGSVSPTIHAHIPVASPSVGPMGRTTTFHSFGAMLDAAVKVDGVDATSPSPVPASLSSRLAKVVSPAQDRISNSCGSEVGTEVRLLKQKMRERRRGPKSTSTSTSASKGDTLATALSVNDSDDGNDNPDVDKENQMERNQMERTKWNYCQAKTVTTANTAKTGPTRLVNTDHVFRLIQRQVQYNSDPTTENEAEIILSQDAAAVCTSYGHQQPKLTLSPVRKLQSRRQAPTSTSINTSDSVSISRGSPAGRHNAIRRRSQMRSVASALASVELDASEISVLSAARRVA